MITAESIAPLLAEWQKRLRLQDFNISVRFEQHCESYGNVRLAARYKEAEIVLQDPEFIDPKGLGNKDLEVTLVHELLHVQAGELTIFLAERQNDRYYDDMERVVELTAIALVDQKRRIAELEANLEKIKDLALDRGIVL